MHVAVSKKFAVILLMRIVQRLHQAESYAHGFISMTGIAIGKSKNGNNALTVGRLNITTGFEKEFSGATNELLRRLGKSGRIGVLGQIVFIGDIADDDGSFACPRFCLEGELTRYHAIDLLLRQPSREERFGQARPAASGNRDRSFRSDEGKDSREDRRQWLEKHIIKQANPEKNQKLD